MIDFIVNKENCTRCGECAADCPARIIAMEEGYPAIAPEKDASCYRCQHCFAICPTGAVSILGCRPGESRPLAGRFPDPEQVETLLKGRRSVRRYLEEDLEPELLQRLLAVAWHAPTGRNTRQVRFTVVDSRAKLVQLRDELMAGLSRKVRDGSFPQGMEFYANLVRLWEEERLDFLFRGAPHFLVASAPQGVVTPVQDCLIALSYFELFAQSLGIGTVWDGLAKWAISDLLPESRERLGIPPDHVIGYTMAFGRPAVRYARTAQHGPADVHYVR